MGQSVIYPGSFDPITYGHIDLIKRAAHSFDKVIVAVAHNTHKTTLFTIEERVQMVEEVKATEMQKKLFLQAHADLMEEQI